MTDLRPFLPLFYAQYSAQNQKHDALYSQWQAAGAESFELQFQNGRILSSRTWSDLEITMLCAQKKGKSWRATLETAQDIRALSEWHQTSERMMKSATVQSDPRPAFGDIPKYDVMPQSLFRYDPQVASLLPALVYHRAFQTFQTLLKSGFLMDAVCTWHHGGRSWQETPLTFAWCDTHRFCFLPQTRIDEAISLFSPEFPKKRRFLAFSNDKLASIPPIHLWLEHLQTAMHASWIDWHLGQFDRIVLMPSVMARIVTWILKYLPQLTSQDDLLHRDIILIDEPENPAFRLNGLIASDGTLCKSNPIIRKGNVTSFFQKSPSAAIFCPVLRAANVTVDAKTSQHDENYPIQTTTQPQTPDVEFDMSPFVPETISTRLPGKILCIEHAQILAADTSSPKLYLPNGAILCRNGQCIGHVVPPSQPLDLLNTIRQAVPVTDPIRIGGIAACGVAYEPT